MGGNGAEPVPQRLRRAEEERTRDLEDLDPGRDHAASHGIGVVLEVVRRIAKLVRSTLMFTTSAMRRMNRKAASTIPTSIATVRSTSTVKRKVVSCTTTSPLGARNSA